MSLHCCSPGHKSKVRSALNFPEGDEEKSEETSKPELEDQADFVGQEGEEPVGRRTPSNLTHTHRHKVKTSCHEQSA